MAYGTYDRWVFDLTNSDGELNTAVQVEAGTGVVMTKTLVEPVTVSRFGFLVKSGQDIDYDTTTARSKHALYKYPLGDNSKKVKLAEIEIAQGYKAGHVYYVDVDNKLGQADFQAGDQIVDEIIVSGAGAGTELGDVYPFVSYNPRAAVAAEQTNMHNLTVVPVTGNGADGA